MSDEKATTIDLSVDPGCEGCGNRRCDHSTEVCGPPPPITRRRMVIAYFVSYVVETKAGRQYGNQVLQVPEPIFRMKHVRSMEALIAGRVPFDAKGRGPRLVGQKDIEVIITNIVELMQYEVEEVVTAEGEASAAKGETVPDADQQSAS